MKIKEIIKEYFNRNKKYTNSENIIHEMNGAVLHRANIQMYDFHSDLVKEIIAYCKNNGFSTINKIIFLSSFDTDVNDSPKINIKMEGKTEINIIKDSGNIIVIVCMYEWVNINRN